MLGGGRSDKQGKGKNLQQRMAAIQNMRGVPDTEEADPWKHRAQKHWRLIILFQHNLDILLQAVDGYRRASDIMVQNTIIVDNSLDKEAFRSDRLQASVAEVVKTPRLLNFPQVNLTSNILNVTAFLSTFLKLQNQRLAWAV